MCDGAARLIGKQAGMGDGAARLIGKQPRMDDGAARNVNKKLTCEIFPPVKLDLAPIAPGSFPKPHVVLLSPFAALQPLSGSLHLPVSF